MGWGSSPASIPCPMRTARTARVGTPITSPPGQHRPHGSERAPSPAPTAPPPGQRGFRDRGRGPSPAQTASTSLPEKGPGRGCGTAPSPARPPGAGALRDLHGGSSGGARGRDDLAWSGTGSAAARTPKEEGLGSLPKGRSHPATAATSALGAAPPPSHTRSDRYRARLGEPRPSGDIAHLHSDRATPGGRGTAPRRRRRCEEARPRCLSPLRSARRPARSAPRRRAALKYRPARCGARAVATPLAAPPRAPRAHWLRLGAARRDRPVRPRCSAYILFHPTMPRGGARRGGAGPGGRGP